MATQRKKKTSAARTTGARRGKAAPDNTARNRVLLIAGVVLVAAVLGVLLWLAMRPEPGIAGVVQFPRQSRGHESNLEIAFGELPPSGGVHDPAWQNCGVYDAPLNTANAIHSMEHGAVWITYQPDLPADQIAAIQDAVRGQNFLVVSPYPQQRSPIVLTAWEVQLELDSVDDSRFEEFIGRYRLGPNTPERGAACTNGIGDPIG
ncbi:DUF3105 domain-containing protein [Promineifilum sp.]|uniref:DUF3105 domain-containing protein n=1 Tax=Promineifilum sp. TaxID=2664178 RepID=UPI0035AD87E6